MTLLLIAVAWLAGVAVAALGYAWLWPTTIAIAFTGTAACVATGRSKAAFWCLPLALTVIGGAWRFDATAPPRHPGGVAVFADASPVTLRGVVADDPELRGASQRVVVEVDAYRDAEGWQPSYGRVLVTVRPFPAFAYGDVVELRGELESAPELEGFDYGAYLRRQGIVAVSSFPGLRRTGTDGGNELRHVLGDARNAMGDSLASALPEPHAALAQGILLGLRAGIPRDVSDDMNRAGISHIVAISGYNVTLIAGFIVALLAWVIGRRPAVIAAMLFLPVFALFVGGSASVLRAAVMGEVMLGAQLAGRPGSGLTAVAVAAALLTAWRPVIVQYVGFQLSVAATAGIVVLAPALQERLEPWLARLTPGGASFIAESVSLTLAASLAASPIVAVTFGRVSLVSLVPANVVAALLFPFVLAGAFVTSVAGLASQDLGRAVGELAYLPLQALMQTGRVGASLPYAAVATDGLGLPSAVLCYVALALLAWRLRRRARPTEDDAPRAFRLQPGLALAVALVVGSGWLAYDGMTADAAPSQLTVSVLDVGQGDATLIQTRDGLRVLVDGGPSPDRLLQTLASELPPSARRIDLVVLSDARDEHAAGLVELMQRYNVGAVLTTPHLGTSPSFRALRDELYTYDVRLLTAAAGQTLHLGDNVRLHVVAPFPMLASAEAAPLVLRLVDGEISFLLAGALPAGNEPSVFSGGFELQSTVLMLPRHGAESAWTRQLITAVAPSVGVISVGPSATGMPAPATELALHGITELRTDRNGTVRMRSDGARLTIDYGRGAPRRLHNPVK